VWKIRLKSKSISRKGAKVLKAQRKQGGSSLRVFAPWRELFHFFTRSNRRDVCATHRPRLSEF
jgi:hypothetical protein